MTLPADMHDASTSIERTQELVALGVEVDSSSGMRRTLLCDPLTGLVSYPSFEEHLTREFPRAGAPRIASRDRRGRRPEGVRDGPAAIATRRCSVTWLETTACGRSARRPSSGRDARRRGGRFAICATFGGDEVIVAGAGVSYERFGEAIGRLRDVLGDQAPRTCSFATGATGPRPFMPDAAVAYRCLVASVDHALFARRPAGELVAAGVVDLTAQPTRPDN